MTKLQIINAGGDFLYGYLSAATFTAHNDDDQGTFPWPLNPGSAWEPTHSRLAEIIDWRFLRQAVTDCRAFRAYLDSLMLHDFKYRDGIVTLAHEAKAEALDALERAGSDFWFTRNGHGVGFWGGDWAHGDELTALAQHFPEIDDYVYRGRLTLY